MKERERERERSERKQELQLGKSHLCTNHIKVITKDLVTTTKHHCVFAGAFLSF